MAAPDFLGRLRGHLDRPLSQRVVATLDKDWTGQDDARIKANLDAHLT